MILKWKLASGGTSSQLDLLVPFRILNFTVLFSLIGSTSINMIQGMLGDPP